MISIIKFENFFYKIRSCIYVWLLVCKRDVVGRFFKEKVYGRSEDVFRRSGWFYFDEYVLG